MKPGAKYDYADAPAEIEHAIEDFVEREPVTGARDRRLPCDARAQGDPRVARHVVIVAPTGEIVAKGTTEVVVHMSDANDKPIPADKVRDRAYAPYSRFKVGAAIRATGGAVHVGCNVENVAYPEGTCAEAGAIAAMIAAGDTRIAEVCVIADSPDPVPPCGGCRQKLAEFGKAGAQVTLATLDGQRLVMSVGDLLPGKFELSHMDKAK